MVIDAHSKCIEAEDMKETTAEATIQRLRAMHCATAFSMQSCAESAYQPYADGYH